MEQLFGMNTSCELLQVQNLYSDMNLQSLFQWGLGVFCSGCCNSSSFKSIHLKLFLCKEIIRRMRNKGSFKKPTHSIYVYSNAELEYYSHENVAHKDYWTERLQRKIKNTWKIFWKWTFTYLNTIWTSLSLPKGMHKFPVNLLIAGNENRPFVFPCRLGSRNSQPIHTWMTPELIQSSQSLQHFQCALKKSWASHN